MENWKNLVNLIALSALLDYPRDIKEHCNWGWKVGILYPNDDQIHYNYNWPYYTYCFADAVTSAAKIMARNSHIGYVNTWVEPDNSVQREKDTEYCKWILRNNIAKNDYTTLENMAYGLCNIPNGGIYDDTYDKEYRKWIETKI